MTEDKRVLIYILLMVLMMIMTAVVGASWVLSFL